MMHWLQWRIDRWRVCRMLRRDGWIERGKYWERP